MEKNTENIILTTAKDYGEFIERAYSAYKGRFGEFTFRMEDERFKSLLRERCEWLYDATVKIGRRFTEYGMKWKEIEMDVINNEKNGIFVVTLMPLGGLLLAFGFYLNDNPSGKVLYEVTLHECDENEKIYSTYDKKEFVGYLNGVIELYIIINKALNKINKEEF